MKSQRETVTEAIGSAYSALDRNGYYHSRPLPHLLAADILAALGLDDLDAAVERGWAAAAAMRPTTREQIRAALEAAFTATGEPQDG